MHTDRLLGANAVFDAVERIGLPEALIDLGHGVTYLALAKNTGTLCASLYQGCTDSVAEPSRISQRLRTLYKGGIASRKVEGKDLF